MKEALEPFGVPLTPALADSLRKFLALLVRWNQKINLTAASDSGELLRRHVGESLFGARVLPARAGTLYDIGAGAGFPGIPIRLIRPDWEVVLVEADRRKAAFLSEAVRTLDLGRTRVVAERFKQTPVHSCGVDVITARALGRYEELLDWAHQALLHDGIVALWIGAGDAENLTRLSGWKWRDPVLIPESRERVLLVGNAMNRKEV